MRRLIRFSLVLAALVAGSFATAAPPASAASDLQCNTGTYNFRVTTTGACAWGNISVLNLVTFVTADINLSVMDNANDGVCAHVDYRLKVKLTGIGDTHVISTACGRGHGAPAQKSLGYSPVESLYIRVCATGKHCSSWQKIF